MKSPYRTHYVGQLNAQMEGKEVVLAGWVHEIRDIGKIIFIQLRDHSGIVQVTVKMGEASQALIEASKLPKESVISVRGVVKANPQAHAGFEIIPKEIRNINPLASMIPFEVTGKVPAEIDVRLDYRHIDLRRLETTAVFNVVSTVLGSFRKIVSKEGFQEIRTPGIVEEATEGGTDLFQLQYFEKKAYLAQSPQLYKQLAVIGGMDRVFMIMPVYRAEKHNTIYHLNESTQMDIEMGFATPDDAIMLLKKVVVGILKDVAKANAQDLKTLDAQFVVPKPRVITYKQALSKLNANGIKMEFGEDFTREHEARLCELYGELLVVKEYPTAVRAFYSMPNEKDPEVSNSYDLIYKGIEISSGAQRIHDPAILVDAIRKRGLDENAFSFYINAFKQGAPPHAGWSIGAERFAMKITNRQNIRECALFPRDRDRVRP